MGTKRTWSLHMILLVVMMIMGNACGFQSLGPGGPKSDLVRRTTALRVAEKKPRWTELPRVRQSQSELSGFEINTGRVAMVGFLGLLAREISSGESFGQQLIHAVSVASGSDLHI